MDCNGTEFSPIKSLARRVHHIVSHAPKRIALDITISTYFDSTGPKQVRPRHISDAVKRAVKNLGMERYGFPESQVSSHSLRAGGAMALKLNGVDCITVKKQGRWSSNTFMMYIHEQISALSAGLATKMSTYIPFTNMGPPPKLGNLVDELADTPR